MVGDGRTQYNAKDNYSPTPSRDELLILLHLAAKFDWDIVHIDEVRAFMNATYKGDTKVYAKFQGDEERYYEVLKAIYGLKSSPKDYNVEVRKRLEELSFEPLHMSPQLFVLRDRTNGSVIVIYDYVDDFVIMGNSVKALIDFIQLFREKVTTTEPIWNPAKLLGMELERDREKRIIKVTMKAKILQAATEFGVLENGIKHVPMPQSGYVVKLDELEAHKDGALLDHKGNALYMRIVGVLLWVIGVRLDSIFAVTYLTWFTRESRVHHLKMALYVLTYLYNSIDVPLVLGGTSKIKVQGSSDSSLGTGPKGRSISSHMMRLGDGAGAVIAKATASQTVFLNTFESELDSCGRAMKTFMFAENFLQALEIEQEQPDLAVDNFAMHEFVQGKSMAKGVRHMELRMWFIREQYKSGRLNLRWESGKKLEADYLTKLATRAEHLRFQYNIQGLALLEVECMDWRDFED